MEARERSEPSDRPFIVDSRYCASGENFEAFGHRLKALAFRCGFRRAKQVAFVADGARCLWSWARDARDPSVVLIQDFWHVCEHLSALSRDLRGEMWQETFQRWKALLLDSEVDQVLNDLRRERKRCRGFKRKRLDQEIVYLEAGRARMDSRRYREADWPIGSGAIEGTCKHLVKERFNVTGAQWRRTNIPSMFALRVSQANDDWEKHWNQLQAA